MADTTGETPTPAAQVAAQPNETPAQVEGEEFDAKRAMALIEKLRSEVKELKPKAKQAEELAAAVKAKEEAEMTELQKANKRLAELDAELTRERRNALVASIAAKHGLPERLATRLQGETPEELDADAVELAKLITPSETPKPKTPGPVNPGANGTPGETWAQQKARITGQSEFYDPFAVGGGVKGL